MIYPRLPTLDTIDAEYEVLVARIRDAYHDKNTAEAEIERLKGDPTESGTSIFETRSAAERYYSAYYPSGKRAVEEKLAAGEISIDPNPKGEGYWDRDRRWWKPFYAEHLERCRQQVINAHSRVNTIDAACTINRSLRWNIKRLATVSEPTVYRTNSKAALGAFLRDARYSLRKKSGPVYGDLYMKATHVTSDIKEKIELDPRSVLCVSLIFKGVQHDLAFLTISDHATDIHWGPRCTGVTAYLVRDALTYVESGAHLARLIEKEK